MSFVKRIWARFLRQQHGGVLVEFTLVVPIVMGFGFAAIEFGNAFYGYQQMTTGVRDAARFLARFDDPSSKIAAAKTLAVTGLVSGSTPRLKSSSRRTSETVTTRSAWRRQTSSARVAVRSKRSGRPQFR